MRDGDVIEFRLFIAGELPGSRRAVENLRSFCTGRLPGRHRIEILDVFECPERALAERILLTPQLVVLHGLRKQVLVGDLSDEVILERTVDRAGNGC